MTNEEAKAKAGGKTLGEKFKEAGYTPKPRGRGGSRAATGGALFPTSPPAPAGDDACCGNGG